MKNNDYFVKDNIAEKILGSNNHYFFHFGLQNINLYYQLTHSKLNDFYQLTESDIINHFYKNNTNKIVHKPQFMSNYFYYVNDELIFKRFDNFIKNKLELKYISDFRDNIYWVQADSKIKINFSCEELFSIIDGSYGCGHSFKDYSKNIQFLKE